MSAMKQIATFHPRAYKEFLSLDMAGCDHKLTFVRVNCSKLMPPEVDTSSKNASLLNFVDVNFLSMGIPHGTQVLNFEIRHSI
jgi:hypothetical protein